MLSLDWADYFPFSLSADTSVEVSDIESFISFVTQNYENLFGGENGFPIEDFTPQKLRYYQEAGDFFAFVSKNRTVGIFVGTTTDWSTYYLRTAAILPEHQGHAYFGRLLARLFDILAEAGVQRVEGDVSSGNLKQIHTFNKLQFNITGYRVSDRGGLIHFTKFLSKQHEARFLKQFCACKPQQDSTEPQLERRTTMKKFAKVCV